MNRASLIAVLAMSLSAICNIGLSQSPNVSQLAAQAIQLRADNTAETTRLKAQRRDLIQPMTMASSKVSMLPSTDRRKARFADKLVEADDFLRSGDEAIHVQVGPPSPACADTLRVTMDTWIGKAESERNAAVKLGHYQIALRVGGQWANQNAAGKRSYNRAKAIVDNINSTLR
jgi:hypothetical protein